MISTSGKIAVTVAVLAVLGAAGVAAAGFMGKLPPAPSTRPLDRVLVVVTAPDDSGTECAALAFVMEAGSSETLTLDTLRDVSVSGTSAKNARQAFAFGGGSAVAAALAGQTEGETLDWVVVDERQWPAMVDASSGVAVTLSRDLSTYVDGDLLTVPAGENTISGTQALSVASGLPYLDAGERTGVSAELAEGVSRALSAQGGLRELVASGQAESSVSAQRLSAF